MKQSIGDTRFIVVVGGVISGVGKGVATASIGRILQERGHSVTLIKIDPYINCDAGTLRPTEHGEVWVTKDGGEIDQDLGTYERFLDKDFCKKNNLTTGQIYKSVIEKERHGQYLGQTVQFIPHITGEITQRIVDAAKGYDVAIIEIGGTVGDHENVPFLFSMKSLERMLGPNRCAYVLVTYLPVPGHIEEMKTKPTQQAVRMLCEQGIMPDFIVCRSKQPLDDARKKKIEEYAHVSLDHIIAAPDVQSIYQMPLVFEEQQFGQKISEQLHLKNTQKPDWTAWNERVNTILASPKTVKIAIVGKYTESGNFALTDSYLSVSQALIHAGAELGVKVEIVWVQATLFEKGSESGIKALQAVDGVIVPGGFGATGVEGKIACIEYVRTHNIPFLGICYGLQLAVVEFARHVVGLKEANTTEVDAQTPYPVVTILPTQKEILQDHRYGGTMRLGAYTATLNPGSLIAATYGYKDKKDADVATERHRHRYEVNPKYVEQLQKAGLDFSAYTTREDGARLVECIELAGHPYFVATQAHPEFTSRFGNPNPLFYGLIRAVLNK